MDSSAETLIITSCADVSICPLVLNIRSWVFLFVYCFVWDKFIMCVLCAFHYWYDLFAVIEVYKNTFGIVNTIYKSSERPFFFSEDPTTVTSEKMFYFYRKQTYYYAYYFQQIAWKYDLRGICYNS